MATQEVQPIKNLVDVRRRYLRPMEIVAQTGLSKGMVFNALYAGELKGHRVGRAWLIPVEEMERWIRGDELAA
ncbi:MAG: helix-turn-helix domain-containing protein [Chloroflexota bacterium]|nr:helix-turn-helix domain-containing protein [Chloroflexota bacterium]